MTLNVGQFYGIKHDAGMILREMEHGKKYVVRVDMGMTTYEMFVNFGQRCPRNMDMSDCY